MKISSLAIFLLVGSLSLFAQRVSESDPERNMENLRSMLENGTVVKVQVLHVPDSTLTRVGLSPEALRSIASINRTFSGPIKETFKPLLSGVSAKKEDQKPDLRWGLLFYDSQDHEIATVFVDKFGRYGYLGSSTVSFETGTFSANLARRLHRLISDSR